MRAKRVALSFRARAIWLAVMRVRLIFGVVVAHENHVHAVVAGSGNAQVHHHRICHRGFRVAARSDRLQMVPAAGRTATAPKGYAAIVYSADQG